MSKALLAKQPILDNSGEVVACELLFRSSDKNYATIDSNSLATACVIANVLSIGLEKIVGKRKAFINVDKEFLLSTALETLPPHKFVIEILEDVVVDGEVINRVKELKAKGYTLAIDDLDVSEEMLKNFEPILEFVSILKIDLMACGGIDALGKKVDSLLKYNLKLLVEKVETLEEYEACKKMGFDYFQGYFFQKPIMVEGKKIDPLKSQAATIIGLINKDADLEEIANEIQKSPELTINLLKHINSSAFATKRTISTIHQAVALLGKSNISQWLVLFLYTGSDSLFSSPLIETSVIRANIMHNIAMRFTNDKLIAQKSYLVGLLSFFDAIMQLPMDIIKEELLLDEEMFEAITTKKNQLGSFLKISRYIERGEWDELQKIAQKYKIDVYEFSNMLSCAIK